MNNRDRQHELSLMMSAGNFFEDGFPKTHFRNLLWQEANAESDSWERKAHLQDMAVLWTDEQLIGWRNALEL
jgi:hypothetical protein